MNRRDQRLIDPKRLAELEERAQDGVDMREALNSLQSKHYRMMTVRRNGVTHPDEDFFHADGWLEFESDLGDALLKIRQRREGDLPAGEFDEDAPF